MIDLLNENYYEIAMIKKSKSPTDINYHTN